MFSCGNYEILRTTNLKVATASDTCSFTWIALFNNLHFRLRLVHMLKFLYNNLRFRLPIQKPGGVLQKRCSYKFSKIHRKTSENKDSFLMKLKSLTLSKKSFWHRCSYCEFCKISHKTFLKEPFRQLFLHKTCSVYFPTTTLCLFKNDVKHIFHLSIFSA